jgi:hypothetical protein
MSGQFRTEASSRQVKRDLEFYWIKSLEGLGEPLWAEWRGEKAITYTCQDKTVVVGPYIVVTLLTELPANKIHQT